MPKNAQYYLHIVLIVLLLQALLEGCSLLPETSALETPTISSSSPSEELVEYRNPRYGFSFPLPTNWRGYSITTGEWEGLATDSERGDVVVERGPTISIVHPDSTLEKPRQNIPIMVFTVQQWEDMQQGGWHVGAAPIGPTEQARNPRYVFALPARYNYSFPEGWEEVEQILGDHPIQTFDPSPP